MQQELFPAEQYKTEGALWRHLETAIGRLNDGLETPTPKAVTMGDVITQYIKEYLPELSKTTQDTDRSMLNKHVRPMWGEKLIGDIKPDAVEKWLKTLKMSGASRGRARRMIKQLFDRAMFWEYLPAGENPITLVKVRGVSLRVKVIHILTQNQVNALVAVLQEPYNLMVLVAAGLGLRVSEVVALQWDDIDQKAKTITIRRAYTHSALKGVKTEASEAVLPISDMLLDALFTHRSGSGAGEQWVFPSPVTGHPYSADTILNKKIKPAAAALGLPKIGWHTFRHSYKSWLGGGKATLTQQKDMLRHADISTTANIYGGTPVEEMRPLHEAVTARLCPPTYSPATNA
jgi:integrase